KLNHSTSYGYTKPKSTPFKPKAGYKSSTRSNPLPNYDKLRKRQVATTTRRYGELPRLHMPAPRYISAPQYKSGMPYVPARYVYAKPLRGNAPILKKSPRYTPSSPKSYITKGKRTSTKSYFVQKGDSLYSIASQFGTSYRTLLSNNREITDPSNIHVGDMIKIPR
ncbi:MAG: LysM peptidoglycan-binding domain-containing protein, partial [Methylococcales bacterium]|nr:LysM peptidoglycan-binding domain-containing protein [Methylococcales bacterium]